MSTLTFASAAEDVAALDATANHHAHLAGELVGRVAMLHNALHRDPGAAENVRVGLLAYCDDVLLPYLAAKETVLYPAAHRVPEARLLVESLIAERGCVVALIDALRTAPTATGAAADARALEILFEEHLAKDTGLVLPLLAAAPDISLTALLAHLHQLLSETTDPGRE
ncbi:hemerythrin domain-containing protein [Streptomyces sp. NPDC005931]|uniref:hemerythrin domain-containing protein n=1 Tax=Streptomyces sp. NPDC005931 TaxID=3364737 RepID=UPI0036843CFE